MHITRQLGEQGCVTSSGDLKLSGVMLGVKRKVGGALKVRRGIVTILILHSSKGQSHSKGKGKSYLVSVYVS